MSLLGIIACRKEPSNLKNDSQFYNNSKVDLLIKKIRNENKYQIFGRSNEEYSYYEFSSHQELLDSLESLKSLSIGDLIALENNRNFLSYYRLFESIMLEENALFDSLDLITGNIVSIDTSYWDSIYNTSIEDLLDEFQDFISVETNGGMHNYSPIVFQYHYAPVLNPLGIVVVGDNLLHFNSDGVEVYDISENQQIPSHFNTASLQLFKKTNNFNEGVQNRSANWSRRCEKEREKFKIIVDHQFRRINIPTGNFSITTFGAKVRVFQKRFFGAWWGTKTAHQARLDWQHYGNLVSCTNPSNSEWSPQSVNFTGGHSAFSRPGVHDYSVDLPINPGWEVYICTSNPEISQSWVRGEVIVGDDRLVIDCSVNYPE